MEPGLEVQLIEAMNPDWRDLTDEIDVNATLVELKAGAPLRLTLIHLQIVLLTCAKSILPSTFLRAAIAERFMLASQARCGSVCGTTGTGASMGSLPNIR